MGSVDFSELEPWALTEEDAANWATILQSVPMPGVPTIPNTAEQTLAAQVKYAPKQYAAEAMYRPKYAALDLGIMKNNLTGSQVSHFRSSLLSSLTPPAPVPG